MDKKKPTKPGHVPHPRSDDVNYDATEPERIRDIERQRPAPRDPDEFVTDAELEAREIDRESEEG